MVFLRLTVKVFPRDQPDQLLPSSSFSIRSYIPGNRDRDDSSRNSSSAISGKPASFLIVLKDPEEVTLGGLAGMIQDKWLKLRPDVGPLEIKKLVDDEHEADDLDAEMTVAEVFVDMGKARVDGLDQRRTVRVIQKPFIDTATHAPVRFPSVTQDWDAAAQHYERMKKEKKEETELLLHKLPPISESDEARRNSGSTSLVTDVTNSWVSSVGGRARHRDIPVSSVGEGEISVSPSNTRLRSPFRGDANRLQGVVGASVRQQKRLGSQELGDSPLPMCGTTPKGRLSVSRRDSMHSQVSVAQSPAHEIQVSDSPALQLERESQSTASPQKSLPPAESKSRGSSPEEVTESESEEESEEESDKSDEQTSGEVAPDKDGDITMQDDIGAKDKGQSIARAKEIPASPAKEGTSDMGVHESKSLKRKNSEDDLAPNKEPRLSDTARATTPITTNSPGKPTTPKSAGTPSISPSSKRERTPSFSGVNRRLSYSGPADLAKPGLGLGITKSPPKKAPVVFDLSQDSAQSGDEIPKITPFIPSSVPVERRGSLSLSQTISTPTNFETPADKGKNIHSALRKDATVERSTERRSVSFADGDDIFITGSGPAPPKSTPQTATKPPKGTPAPRSDPKKRLSSGTMTYPPGISQARIDQLTREAEEKAERQKQAHTEHAEKIKAAEERKADPKYVRLLQDEYEVWKDIIKFDKSNRRADKTTATKCRVKLKQLQKEIQNFEAAMNKETPLAQQPKKRVQTPRKSPAPEPVGKASTAKVTPPTTAAGNGPEATPITQVTPWKAVNSDKKTPASAPAAAKPSAPTTNGVTGRVAAGAKSTPKPSTPATRASASKANAAATSKPTPGQSQSSNESDELELPAMQSVPRRTSTSSITRPKKPTPPQEPVELSSSSEESSSSSEEDEDETSSDGSTSSDSEDESEPEQKKLGPGKTKPAQRVNGISSQPAGTSKSPAPSSQPPSASQPWRFPPSSQGARPRASLKGLLQEQKSTPAPPRPANAPPRKSIFSPPDTDSDETEDKSSSEESSDESDNSTSGDEGDIMSSGQVGKLKTPRKTR